jgi:hypothetical protein
MHLGQGQTLPVKPLKSDAPGSWKENPRHTLGVVTHRVIRANSKDPVRIAVTALQQRVEILWRKGRAGGGSVGGEAFHGDQPIMGTPESRDKGFRRSPWKKGLKPGFFNGTLAIDVERSPRC